MPSSEPNPRSGLYLNLLIEAASDFAIFAMDRERRVTMWNRGAERIFGYTEREIVGELADVLFTPEDRAREQPARETAESLRAGRASDDRWHLRKNGERFYASGVMTPLREEDGTHLGFVKINRDLTAQKLAEEKLKASRDGLAAAVAERTRELEAANTALREEITRGARSEEARVELLRRLASGQERERLRISREMHDQLGQHIAALMWRLNMLELAVRETPQLATVKEAQGLVESIGGEVHALAVQLRPTALDDLGLPGAIEAYVQVWSQRCGLRVDTQVINLGPPRLPPEIELALYRILQEALTNVLKHAGASRVQVIVARVENEVAMTIEDNGRGFDVADAETKKEGLGLLGMRERVAAVGGTLVVESSAAGGGTAIFVRVPLTAV